MVAPSKHYSKQLDQAIELVDKEVDPRNGENEAQNSKDVVIDWRTGVGGGGHEDCQHHGEDGRDLPACDAGARDAGAPEAKLIHRKQGT